MPSSLILGNQIAEKSILDLFGRQTYLGNSFCLPQNGFALSDTSEKNIGYISNPSGSGKALFIFGRKAFSDSVVTPVRYYFNPTVTVPSTATTAVNLRTGLATTSVALCYRTPTTVTVKGTLLYVVPASTTNLSSETLIVVDPGTSLLITAQAPSGTPTIYYEVCWFEI